MLGDWYDAEDTMETDEENQRSVSQLVAANKIASGEGTKESS